MTPLETLRQIVEMREKATAGEWHAYDNVHGSGGHIHGAQGRHLFDVMERHAGLERDERRLNGDFVALAGSTDWPAMLAEVERLQAIVDKLPDELREHWRSSDNSWRDREDFIERFTRQAVPKK